MEIKTFGFNINPLEEGMFEGHASIFGNVDAYGDVVVKGAFTRTINNNLNRIKVLWQHDMREPIGKPVEMREDEKGLYIKAKICMTDTGRKCYELMKEGIINEMSIGYDAIVDEYNAKDKIRYLKEIRLWEVSAVTFAANSQARIENVKNLDNMLDEIKEGRVLSGVSKNKIKQAIEALMALLGEEDSDKSTPIIENPPKIDIDSETLHSILELTKKYM